MANKLGAEHRFFEAVTKLSGARDHPLLVDLPEIVGELSRERFMEERTGILRGMFQGSRFPGLCAGLICLAAP